MTFSLDGRASVYCKLKAAHSIPTEVLFTLRTCLFHSTQYYDALDSLNLVLVKALVTNCRH